MNNDDNTEKRLNPNSVQAVPNDNSNSSNNQNSNASDNDESNNDSQNNDNRTIEGYALKFSTPSKPLDTPDGGQFTEVISPKALDGVDLSNVVMLDNHDLSKVLASTKAGTLKLDVDDTGLHYQADLSNTSFADDDLANIKAGNLTDTSFSFAVADDGDTFTTDDDGNVQRTINQIKSLFDVSLVSVGAYDLGSDAVKVDSRSYEKFMQSLKNKKLEKRNKQMTEKTIIKPTNNRNVETSAFENWIRSAGKRDLTGLTTEAGKVVIPSEISTPVLQLKNNQNALSNLVTKRKVGVGSGTLPVALNAGATLKTKEELAEVPDIGQDLLKGVDYKLQTRAGKVYISEEEIEDSVIDIKQTVEDQLSQLVLNTENANIINILTTSGNFQTATATASNGLDDVKKIKNLQLDPALNLTVIVGQTVFNFLDTLKDSRGDYLLQPDVTAQSGKSLFGIPVQEVNDTLLPAAKGMIIGDMEQSVLEAYQPQINANWQEFNYFAQGLAVEFRSDFKPVDKNSAVVINISGLTGGASK